MLAHRLESQPPIHPRPPSPRRGRIELRRDRALAFPLNQVPDHRLHHLRRRRCPPAPVLVVRPRQPYLVLALPPILADDPDPISPPSPRLLLRDDLNLRHFPAFSRYYQAGAYR